MTFFFVYSLVLFKKNALISILNKNEQMLNETML